MLQYTVRSKLLRRDFMRKLISPKCIDRLTETAVFTSGNTALPIHINLCKYNSSTKVYTQIGEIFTTLPYLEFGLREVGDAPQNIDLYSEASVKKVFGGEGEHQYGCSGFVEAETEDGPVKLLCTSFYIGGDSGHNGYFIIGLSGYDLSNEYGRVDGVEVLGRIETQADRYGERYGLGLTGAESDPDTYADKDPIKYDKDLLKKLTEIEG